MECECAFFMVIFFFRMWIGNEIDWLTLLLGPSFVSTTIKTKRFRNSDPLYRIICSVSFFPVDTKFMSISAVRTYFPFWIHVTLIWHKRHIFHLSHSSFGPSYFISLHFHFVNCAASVTYAKRNSSKTEKKTNNKSSKRENGIKMCAQVYRLSQTKRKIKRRM